MISVKIIIGIQSIHKSIFRDSLFRSPTKISHYNFYGRFLTPVFRILVLTDIEGFVSWNMHLKVLKMAAIPGDDETTRELCWGEPEGIVGLLIQLKLSVCPVRESRQELKRSRRAKPCHYVT